MRSAFRVGKEVTGHAYGPQTASRSASPTRHLDCKKGKKGNQDDKEASGEGCRAGPDGEIYRNRVLAENEGGRRRIKM